MFHSCPRLVLKLRTSAESGEIDIRIKNSIDNERRLHKDQHQTIYKLQYLPTALCCGVSFIIQMSLKNFLVHKCMIAIIPRVQHTVKQKRTHKTSAIYVQSIRDSECFNEDLKHRRTSLYTNISCTLSGSQTNSKKSNKLSSNYQN